VHALILAAFFFSPAQSGGLKPVELTGDMRADWLAHAETADACIVDRIPTDNIRASWQTLGVKLLRRAAWDPEGSAEYFRRQAGFLPLHEEADGVWIVGEEKFPETWKRALAEAKVDVDVTLYCKSLAEEALKWREKDNKVWIEGRRVLWFLRHMDFDRENLDTLRLEFVCYAKRLEQLLGVKPRALPVKIAEPIEPDRIAFVPLKDLSPEPVAVSIDNAHLVKLGPGLSFSCDGNGFVFTISSAEGAKGVWPSGTGAFRLYLPDGRGSFLPYEYRLDFSPVETNRAPTDAYGLWFLKERWGRGNLSLYADKGSWRFRFVPHGSYGSRYPRLEPRFDFDWREKGSGWRLKLFFNWLDLYGYWPSLKNNVAERWYVSLDALPGVPSAACRLDWAKGRELNFKRFTRSLDCATITERYAEETLQAGGIYRLWHDERLYGFAKTKEPTYQRCDPESDKVFWERVVKPMVDDNKALADITYTYRNNDRTWVPPPLARADEQTKMSVWKKLGKLFTLAERVSLARRDYILTRYAGKLPPKPSEKGKPAGAAALTAPDADNDDNALDLDDKEF